VTKRVSTTRGDMVILIDYDTIDVQRFKLLLIIRTRKQVGMETCTADTATANQPWKSRLLVQHKDLEVTTISSSTYDIYHD
jgi:hypothetical protein